jgi:sugar phosphate isomerase/epimerase
MNTPLHHHIRPGIVHFMAFPATIKGEGPILDTVRHIVADPYFEVIEISWIKDAAVRAQVKALLTGSAVEVKYGAQPRLLTQKLDLNSVDETLRARAVAEIKLAVDEASELGIRDVGLLSGSDVPAAERPAAMDRLEKSLVELCRYAAPKGIYLVLEVFDRDIDKKALIGPAATARDIAERVKRSCGNFGLMIDLSHIPLLGESPEQALLPVKDHIAHIHIGNAYFADHRTSPAWGDNHPHFGFPGGANDVPEIVAFLKVLFQIGYLKADGSARGNVSFEIKPLPGEDAAVMIAAAKRKLGEAWARLKL